MTDCCCHTYVVGGVPRCAVQKLREDVSSCDEAVKHRPKTLVVVRCVIRGTVTIPVSGLLERVVCKQPGKAKMNHRIGEVFVLLHFSPM